MRHRCVLAVWLLVAAAGCHRTSLNFFNGLPEDAAATADARPGAPDLAPPTPDLRPVREAASDLAPGEDATTPGSDTAPASLPDATLVLPPPVPGCQPQPEVCNGVDDDCDGRIDEDLPAIPCPNGGSRYCVAGKLSECPRLCEVCRPGSQRVCFISYCTYWGVQTCAADGRSFGLCRESPVPPECEAIAKGQKKSAALERCCLDNGYCCRDEYDLDGDGDRTEMLGRCSAVTCPP